MGTEPLYDVWWKKPGESEQAMEDRHAPHWAKVLDAILEKDLSGSSVLDIGYNQGGFLRYLYERRPFRKGVGIDLATQSISVANDRKGDLPLTYFATGEPQQLGEQFDFAVSIFVIYLIRDLRGHAQKILGALKPAACTIPPSPTITGTPVFLASSVRLTRTAPRHCRCTRWMRLPARFLTKGLKFRFAGYIPRDMCRSQDLIPGMTPYPIGCCMNMSRGIYSAWQHPNSMARTR